jgi:ATP-dependent DNA helicase RecQ
MNISLKDILKQYWGFSSFRPLQEEIVQSVLYGNDTLALLPTGGGKSICYQVPAMAAAGLCLVVSPLIALMKDQVEALRRKGITAFAIYSGMKRQEVIQTLKVATNSNCKFLYVSPERLETSLFKEYLPALGICLIAVDEAHCISQWGYDFRPSYLRIAALREELPNIPVLALTASATAEVQADICEKLLFKKQQIFRQSFSRPNLSYSVFKPESKINKLVEILTNVAGSSIVYCKSRRRTQEIAGVLRSYKINSDFYHAGLGAEDRNKKQEAWMKNQVRTMVCTNAFGMGIDKPDVKVVVHVDLPDCLENYYQEAGRAGRDGNKAYAVLLYAEDDIKELYEQAVIRFPTLATIQNTYQAVCNYLQLPVGNSGGIYYEFNIADFINKFGLSALQVIHTLKVLEQEGYLGFNEQVFIPTKAQFICNKERLYQFESENPGLEPIIKLLLRSYEGIFDQLVPVNENMLAKWAKKDSVQVKKELTELDFYHIIQYEPQKDNPQLWLLQPRVRAEFVAINQSDYQRRKQLYLNRVETFVQFVKSVEPCRSQQIGGYFGDSLLSACGICDNCLQQKKAALSRGDFESIKERIELFINTRLVYTDDLLKHLESVDKEKAWEVIQFLQAEKKISITKEGMLKRN